MMKKTIKWNLEKINKIEFKRKAGAVGLFGVGLMILTLFGFMISFAIKMLVIYLR